MPGFQTLLERVNAFCDGLNINRPHEMKLRLVYLLFVFVAGVTCFVCAAAVCACFLVILAGINPLFAVLSMTGGAGLFAVSRNFREIGRNRFEFDRLENLLESSAQGKPQIAPDVQTLLDEMRRASDVFEKQEIRERLIAIARDDADVTEFLRKHGDARLAWMLDRQPATKR